MTQTKTLTHRVGRSVVRKNEDETVALARDASVDRRAKGMARFVALETLLEREVWAWLRREKPGFAFNTVIREVGDPLYGGRGALGVEEQDADVLDTTQPRGNVDCPDTGLLYVAVLASSPRVDRDRIYGFGDRYSWFKVTETLKGLCLGRARRGGVPN